MKIAICTIITKYRLNQCIAMYKSLYENTDEFRFYVLCIDNESYNILRKMNLKDSVFISSACIEDEELLTVKKERELNEYCWTIKPGFVAYIMQNYTDEKVICYVDSDVYFFADISKLIKKEFTGSVMLTTHRINRKCNGGFVCFRNNQEGRSIVEWWKSQCIKWCYAINKNNGFGDQGYLDRLKDSFKNVQYLKHIGANIAPWNYFKFNITIKNGNVYVNNCRLIFYHYSGLRMKKIDSLKARYYGKPVYTIYERYIKELEKVNYEIEKVSPGFSKYFFIGED